MGYTFCLFLPFRQGEFSSPCCFCGWGSLDGKESFMEAWLLGSQELSFYSMVHCVQRERKKKSVLFSSCCPPSVFHSTLYRRNSQNSNSKVVYSGGAFTNIKCQKVIWIPSPEVLNLSTLCLCLHCSSKQRALYSALPYKSRFKTCPKFQERYELRY